MGASAISPGKDSPFLKIATLLNPVSALSGSDN
jgi:hypothetical protein